MPKKASGVRKYKGVRPGRLLTPEKEVEPGKCLPGLFCFQSFVERGAYHPCSFQKTMSFFLLSPQPSRFFTKDRISWLIRSLS